MSAEYRINGFTKSWMLTLALILDAIQLVTPDIMDKLIVAFAAMIFGMIFIEKGALTVRDGQVATTSVKKMARLFIPLGEFFISHIPGITLQIWVMIEISRAADRFLPESLHGAIGLARLKGDAKVVRGDWKNVKSEAGAVVHKGRRAARRTVVRGQKNLRDQKRAAQAARSLGRNLK